MYGSVPDGFTRPKYNVHFIIIRNIYQITKSQCHYF